MSFTASATTQAGRNGHVKSATGAVDLDLAMPKADGSPGKPGATNPEELFASGYSACFGSAVIAVAGAEKLRPDQVTITADVTLLTENNDFRLAVVLKAHIEGLEASEVERIVHKAHEVCPYSKATRDNIKVELEIV